MIGERFLDPWPDPPEDAQRTAMVRLREFPKSATVWLVCQQLPYETEWPMALFESEKVANQFVATLSTKAGAQYSVIGYAVNRTHELPVDGVFGRYGKEEAVTAEGVGGS